MLMALGNPTKEFTATLFLKEKSEGNEYSFEKLGDDEKKIEKFFKEEFPDANIPDLQNIWKSNPTSGLMWAKCNPYNFEGKKNNKLKKKIN
jgi:hypothetical protein